MHKLLRSAWTGCRCYCGAIARCLTFFLLLIPTSELLAQVDSTCLIEVSAYRRAKQKQAAKITPDSLSLKRSQLLKCADNADLGASEKADSTIRDQVATTANIRMDIPEFHDEGRLPGGSDSGGRYLGPMAYIYASPNLDTFVDRSQIFEQGKPGFAAAYVVVEPLAGESIPETYRNLGLQAGMNCVWLFLPDPGRNIEYRAYVVPATSANSCDRDSAAAAIGTSPGLRVVESQGVRGDRFKVADYIAAARFDVDQKGNPTLGFKCASSFCEVMSDSKTDIRHPNEFKENSALKPNDQNSKQALIKGWHDEQELATRENGIWRPSGVRAKIVPSQEIEHLTVDDFKTAKRVATLLLSDNPPPKYLEWGLSKGANEVWLSSSGITWIAEIRRDGKVIKQWVNVHRMPHLGAGVPPTARFRWTTGDDGIWVPCGNACCRADGT